MRWLPEPLRLLLAALLAAAVVAGPRRLAEAPADPTGFAAGVLAGALAGYALHELAHRYAAGRLGCRAEFVLWGPGLAATLLALALRGAGVGVVPVILPGYVAVLCPWRGAEEPPWVAASGPAVNAALAWLGLALAWSSPHHAGLGLGVALVNSWLAVFNLLPFPPLDGYAVVRRSPALWLALLAASGVALYRAYYP